MLCYEALVECAVPLTTYHKMPVLDSLTLTRFADLMSLLGNAMTDVNLLLNPTITGTEAVPSLFSVLAITVPGILMGFS
ncbi:MAG TPA: hypothetical protein VMW89_00280 [Desulfatiglandales bacterium]|nr:hypothetical protein [Desulfatiglandales bacterium]